MIEDTPEQLEVIKQRQRQCDHTFIKGTCDKTHRCPRCGVSQSDWESMTPQLSLGTWSAGGWAPQNGIP